MNQQFWRNHIAQDSLPQQVQAQGPPSSRLASFGQRSISAPNSAESSQDADLRKYMPAGQRVAQRSSLLDESTGMVSMNQQPVGGVWSLMMDGSAMPVDSVRRMRSKPHQQLQLGEQDLRMVEKMKWNPQAEAQNAAKKEYVAQKWESAPSAMPGLNSNAMEQQSTSRSRGRVEHKSSSNSSINLGWSDIPPVQAPPPPVSERSAAPWMHEENSTSRSSRKSVGVDHNKSK